MSNSSSTTILWISDIHIKESDFNTNSKHIFEKYLDAIIYEFRKLNLQVLDYIIISGDLAFEGKTKEYDLFEQHILKPLNSTYSDAIVLYCPGNHDVNFDEVNNLDYLITKQKTIEEKVFLNFNSFIAKQKPKTNEKFSLFEDNFEFGKEKPFILIKDDNKKINFLMLNSSWLSIGGEFYKKIWGMSKKRTLLDENEEDSTKKYKSALTEEDFKKVHEAIENSFEYTSQKLFINDSIDSLIKELKHSEYTTILCCHHPPNWLHWEERFDTDLSYFDRLCQISDLFLSGHEHIPSQSLGTNTLNYDLTHISSGSFMNNIRENTVDNFIDNNKDNWFSLITIENTFSKKYKWEKIKIIIDSNLSKSEAKICLNLDYKKESKFIKLIEKIPSITHHTFETIIKNKLKINDKIDNQYFGTIIEEILEIYISKSDKITEVIDFINKHKSNVKIKINFIDFLKIEGDHEINNKNLSFQDFEKLKSKLYLEYRDKSEVYFNNYRREIMCNFYSDMALFNKLTFCLLNYYPYEFVGN